MNRDHFGVLIFPTRPEESAQSIPPPARHDVNVEVRNALAYGVVDGDKTPVAVHSLLHGSSHKLGIRE